MRPGAVRAALFGAYIVLNAVVVEMTETVIAAYDAQVVTTARALRDLGVSIAIDDFGVGGSSLSRLRELPVDLLKVDRSFVVRTDVDERARAVANAVVALASELGVETLAEGVESSGQLRTMFAAGCALAQGYALGHPMPPDAFNVPLTV